MWKKDFLVFGAGWNTIMTDVRIKEFELGSE